MPHTIKRQLNYMDQVDYRNFVVMNKSNHSYSINKSIVLKFNKDSWFGKRCFILGGGESLKGFDFSRLDNELVIGINKAFQHYPNATINYAMDSDFYDGLISKRYDDFNKDNLWGKWLAFKGTRVFLTPLEIKKFGEEVYLVCRTQNPSINVKDLNDGIYGGKNSGFGAINLAISLGANPIYLLGYDMKAKTQSHWHQGYNERNLTEFNNKLKEYRDEISNFAPLFNQYVTIVNLSPDSELGCFPSLNVDQILKR